MTDNSAVYRIEKVEELDSGSIRMTLDNGQVVETSSELSGSERAELLAARFVGHAEGWGGSGVRIATVAE